MSYFPAFVKVVWVSFGFLTATQMGNAVTTVGSFLYHATARDVHVVNEFIPVTTARALRVELSEPTPAPSTTSSPLPLVEKKKKRDAASVLGASISPSPTPKLKATPVLTPFATPTPTSPPVPAISATPLPTPVPIATSTPIPSPDFAVGTVLVGNNPAQVLTGDPVKFSVFVRDANGTTIKNKTVTFAVNQKALIGTTDDSGNAYLALTAENGFIGKLTVIVQLGAQQVSFNVNVVDTKPDMNLSSFAFTQVGYHVRLRNALGDYIPNWQVTAYRRDGSVLGTERTNELGVIEFPLPVREDGGHMYACAEVKDVGRKCTEW